MAKHCFHFEINTNCWHKCRCKGIICITEKETRFAHTWITDYQQFEHVIEILISCILRPFLITAGCHLKIMGKQRKKDTNKSFEFSTQYMSKLMQWIFLLKITEIHLFRSRQIGSQHTICNANCDERRIRLMKFRVKIIVQLLKIHIFRI